LQQTGSADEQPASKIVMAKVTAVRIVDLTIYEYAPKD
jgi:hypothetical protein